MKANVVNSSTLQAAGRWDAAYVNAIVDYLAENGVEETPENVREAMKAIRERDTAAMTAARSLRDEAEAILNRARDLEQSADLTYPHGMRMR